MLCRERPLKIKVATLIQPTPTRYLEEGRLKRKETGKAVSYSEFNGRGGGIRTRDPLHPMQVRYQAALRPDVRMGILHNPILFGKLFVCPTAIFSSTQQLNHK